jgi:hypothetical protein
MLPETYDRARALLNSAEWIFAKTMPKYPHHYTLRKNWKNDVDFIFVVEFIRENGYIEVWHRRRFVAHDFDGYKFWTMGDTIPNTTLINRKALFDE